jgi:hypothetical protein
MEEKVLKDLVLDVDLNEENRKIYEVSLTYRYDKKGEQIVACWTDYDGMVALRRSIKDAIYLNKKAKGIVQHFARVMKTVKHFPVVG